MRFMLLKNKSLYSCLKTVCIIFEWIFHVLSKPAGYHIDRLMFSTNTTTTNTDHANICAPSLLSSKPLEIFPRILMGS